MVTLLELIKEIFRLGIITALEYRDLVIKTLIICLSLILVLFGLAFILKFFGFGALAMIFFMLSVLPIIAMSAVVSPAAVGFFKLTKEFDSFRRYVALIWSVVVAIVFASILIAYIPINSNPTASFVLVMAVVALGIANGWNKYKGETKK